MTHPGGKSAGGLTPEVLPLNNLEKKSPNFFSSPKVCTKCGLPKPRTVEFFPSDARKADGLRADCRECFSAARLARYVQKRTEAGIAYQPSAAHRGPKPRANGYAIQDRALLRMAPKVKTVADRMRDRIRRAVGPVPKGHYSLGCTPAQLRTHLERQFLRGMSWANRTDWHIDHIRPLASFDLTDPDQIKTACHFTNLRPIWAKDNLRKGATKELLI